MQQYKQQLTATALCLSNFLSNKETFLVREFYKWGNCTVISGVCVRVCVCVCVCVCVPTLSAIMAFRSSDIALMRSFDSFSILSTVLDSWAMCDSFMRSFSVHYTQTHTVEVDEGEGKLSQYNIKQLQSISLNQVLVFSPLSSPLLSSLLS